MHIVLIHGNIDRNIILQMGLLLKGHGNYDHMYGCAFTVVTDFNRNDQAGAGLSFSNSVLSLITKNN